MPKLRPSLAYLSLLLVTQGCPQCFSKPTDSAETAKLATHGATDPALDAARTPLASAQRVQLGTNLEGLADWSEAWGFVDGFKRSRSWISGTEQVFDDRQSVQVDEHGWVTSLRKGQVARTLMFWGGVHYPSGDYVILYEGKGSFYSQPYHPVVSDAPGRRVLRVDSQQGGIEIILTETDPKDPIRNIRVLMPGGSCDDDSTLYCDAETPCASGAKCTSFEHNYATQIFHPRYLKLIAPYAALRFMDWMATNDSKLERWQDRPKPEDARFHEGAPVEVMVELANRLKQDAWFTMPHRANDEYVRKFAEYVRDHLSPDLRVYVEHSNEVWNAQFSQSEEAEKHGRALNLGESPFEAQLKYHARRTVQMGKIWADALGKQQNRLVRVLGAQAANSWTAEIMLAFEDTKKHVEAVAIAPYIGGSFGTDEHLARYKTLSLDDFFKELKTKALPEARSWIEQNAKVARENKVALLAYEGGQHLTGVGPRATDDDALNSLFDRANRDPRMGELYTAHLASWRELGGGLFLHFVDCAGSSKWGRWGALEWMEQPREQAPKFDALMRYLETPR